MLEPAAPASRTDGLSAWLVRGVGLALGAVVVITLAAAVMGAARVLVLVFIAILLGSALEPLIDTLRAKLRTPRGGTILLVYAAFFTAVLLLGLVVAPAALEQGTRTLALLPGTLEEGRRWAASALPAPLAAGVDALLRGARDVIVPASAPSPDTIVQVGLTAAEALVSVTTVLALVFFWVVERAQLQRYVLAFVPAEGRATVRDTWNEAEDRLGRWVRGQLVLMGIIGLATGIVYVLLGLPSALLLALIAAVCEIVPIVGPLLGAIPALVVAATVSPETAVLVAVAYLVIQFVEGNVLVPIVMRNTIGLSPFLVLVSLLIGGALAGMPGALLAIPIAAAIEVVLERLQVRESPVAPELTTSAEPEVEAGQEPEARSGEGEARPPATLGGTEARPVSDPVA